MYIILRSIIQQNGILMMLFYISFRKSTSNTKYPKDIFEDTSHQLTRVYRSFLYFQRDGEA
jgi:hypothetical protein